VKPKKRIIAASALLAPFALAAIFLYGPTGTPAISPSQVFTWDCEFPAQKPATITLTCADGGIFVDHIDWSQWNSQGAQGIGIYNANDCKPSCAEGTYVQERVKVQVTRLVEYQSKQFLRTLEIRTLNGKNLPHGRANSYEWDLMEFAEMMGAVGG
jgi:hypothetical protein